MKIILLISLVLNLSVAQAQTAENVIIITTDGLRWQEVFGGMDSALANNKKFNQDDSAGIYNQYWAADAIERRKKLMPFLWSTIEKNGQIYGNRNLGSKIDNANPYWFSYPGYSEIFTGYPDTAINSNAYPANPHITVLEYLNSKVKYKNKVAAFGAWFAFDRILNEERGKFPVYSAFDKLGGNNPTAAEKQLNKMAADSYKPFDNEEVLDVFTHYNAMNYLQTKLPKVLYISYGETDEWAHHSHYKDYLRAATMVDKWIKDIWEFVQSHPQYKNKTSILITTDHGRGDVVKSEWTSHNKNIKDCNQIWLAVMGPNLKPKGEVKKDQQFYQMQIAQTIASLLGEKYGGKHKIADMIYLNQD